MSYARAGAAITKRNVKFVAPGPSAWLALHGAGMSVPLTARRL